MMTSVEDNLGLVHAVASRFKGRGIEYEDLFGAGCLGLVKAVNRFDKDRGACFSTYAVPLIMGEIKGIFRKSGSLTVSRRLKENSLKINRVRTEYISQYGKEPTIAELALICGLSKDQTLESLCACRPPLSLIRDDDEYIDIPIDFGEENIAEHISLRQEIERLPDDDRKLIELRYFRSLTQSQTADLLGISQVQVCRREKKILSILRDKLR